MQKFLYLLLGLILTSSLYAKTSTIAYNVSDITGTIANIQVAAVAVIGAFITYGLTVMFYRKIRMLASRG